SLCNSRPIFRPVRTASCAAAMLSSRPSATGNTMPGNSTRLRVATIGTASAGNGGSSIRGVEGVFFVSSIMLLTYEDVRPQPAELRANHSHIGFRQPSCGPPGESAARTAHEESRDVG